MWDGIVCADKGAASKGTANFELVIALADGIAEAPISDVLVAATSGHYDAVEESNDGFVNHDVGTTPLLLGAVVYYGWAFLL